MPPAPSSRSIRYWSANVLASFLLISSIGQLRLEHCPSRALGLDVLVHPEEVVGVPAAFDLDQSRQVLPIGGLDAITAFLLVEEVDVGAAGRMLAHLAPRGAGPLDLLV